MPAGRSPDSPSYGTLEVSSHANASGPLVARSILHGTVHVLAFHGGATGQHGSKTFCKALAVVAEDPWPGVDRDRADMVW